jgi:hypothetical protein
MPNSRNKCSALKENHLWLQANENIWTSVNFGMELPNYFPEKIS